MTRALTNARDVAVEALRDRAGNVSARLRRLLAQGAIPVADRSLASELALGVVRRKGTLDAILLAFLKQPDRRLPSPLTEILQVALYQIFFLERIPDFAAVSQAVNQTGRLRHRRQSGLVNGVLRSVTRGLSETHHAPPPPRADVIPIGPNAYRIVDRPVFADPVGQPAKYLSGAYSLPEALAARWIERFTSLAGAINLATHANVRAPVIFRVNALRADVDTLISRLAGEGVSARPHENGCSVVLDTHLNITNLAAFREGLFQPQDATATGVVLKANPQAGMNVLDFCAAPGTKTTHIAECMGDSGSITAVDVSADKLERIEENCERLGISIVTTMLAQDIGSLSPGSFDLVLVDVPCSNTGVLARRAEARWRFDETTLDALCGDQKLLLSAAAAFARPGGKVVYSTCSIEPEECGEVVRAVVNRRGGLRLATEELILPAGIESPATWRDGGYVAIIQA